MKKFFIIIVLSQLTFGITYSQEQAPVTNEDSNWISSIAFDLQGRTVTKAISYYNSLGKVTQQQSWEPISKRVWANQTLYDVNGRPIMQTLSAPIGQSFRFESNFILNENNNPYTNFYTPVSPTSFLGKYFSDANQDNKYQDITSFPYSSVEYSDLNPGKALRAIGGNKVTINGQEDWAQSYTFTMPVGQELSSASAFDSTEYNDVDITKTVVRDVHGVDNVIFKDAEGNILAAARSGNEELSTVTPRFNSIEIRENGFVDIHIPQGIPSFFINNGKNNNTQLEVYDLITEQKIATVSEGFRAFTVNSGFYRIAISSMLNYQYNENDTAKITVNYHENYYDYSLNYYDEANRLMSTKQPLSKLETTYTYNSLGQLQETNSVDEGNSKFKYRKDGQIRYSQNTEQATANQMSYTNYDNRARPIESGVYTGFKPINFETLNPDVIMFPGSLSEQRFTIYDVADVNGLDTAFGNDSRKQYYNKQTFVSGNVVKTYNQNPAISTSWYSYDVQGRLKWVVQKIEGMLDPIKTIDYTYDAITGQIAMVDYQQYTPSERFVHKYTYDLKGQLVKTETSKDGVSFQEQAEYKYAESGEMIRSELGDNLQGIDYVYNLNGQLKSINDPSLDVNKDPGKDGTNGFQQDQFGMTLNYYKNDYSRSNTPTPVTTASEGIDQFNGNIKSIAYNTRNQNNNNPDTYYYKYNKNNWIEGASFNQPIGIDSNLLENETRDKVVTSSEIVEATKSVTLEVGFHMAATNTITFEAKIASGSEVSSDGAYNVYDIAYDANGNIQRLNRNKGGNAGTNAMDKLSYSYKTDKPNQLLRVDDAVTVETNLDDIKDQEGNNYEYNEIGQLIRDNSEGLFYVYNASGLATEIQKNNVTLVQFFYNDRGHRVRKQYTPPGLTTYDTYYVRDVSGNPMAIYNITTDKFGVTESLEEYAMYGADRIGVYKKDGASLYELKDHLRNVRSVISKAPGGQFNGVTTATDYYPFGMRIANNNLDSGYRYTFQGQEKDIETGKEAFELRLWDGRIGRWSTKDPYGQYNSPYLGMGNNPINGVDIDGGIFILKGLSKEQRKYWNSYIKKLRSTAYGRHIYNTVENSPHEVNVVWQYGSNNLKGKLGDFFFVDNEPNIMGDNRTYLSFSDRLSVYELGALALEKNHGGSNWKHPIDVVLGHEIYHAYQLITNSSKTGNEREIDAVKFQNFLFRGGNIFGDNYNNKEGLRTGYLYNDSFIKANGKIDLPPNFMNTMFHMRVFNQPQRLDNFPGRVFRVLTPKSSSECGCN